MALWQHTGRHWTRPRSGQDHGIALVTALMMLVAVMAMGSAMATVMTWSRQMSGNYKSSLQALEVAESGAEEARARLRGNAAHPITDTAPTQTQWQAYLGSLAHVQMYGYTGSAQQVRAESLQTSVPGTVTNPYGSLPSTGFLSPNWQYTVKVTHATDSGGNMLYWGDPTGTGTNHRNITGGQNMYVVTSYSSAGGAHRTVQTLVARNPPIPPAAALYVSDVTTIQGNSTNILGQDQCGSTNVAGLATPLGATTNGSATITQNGGPTISGTPNIQYNHVPLNIPAMVNALKGAADFSYNVTSVVQTSNTTPGPGDHWGTPTAGADLQHASACTEYHTVYYNTNNTYVQFSGGVSGCGVLLVDGDLIIHGDFSWYGPILATGSITYTGGGNKNTTGEILSGGSVAADVVGGNANVVFCSDAVQKVANTNPLLVLSWGTL